MILIQHIQATIVTVINTIIIAITIKIITFGDTTVRTIIGIAGFIVRYHLLLVVVISFSSPSSPYILNFCRRCLISRFILHSLFQLSAVHNTLFLCHFHHCSLVLYVQPSSSLRSCWRSQCTFHSFELSNTRSIVFFLSIITSCSVQNFIS